MLDGVNSKRVPTGVTAKEEDSIELVVFPWTDNGGDRPELNFGVPMQFGTLSLRVWYERGKLGD